MKTENLYEHLSTNAYPGRGVLIGKSDDGQNAVIAYFIMGRSQNSRNRVFTPKAGGIITEAADPILLEDPSLIIYAPVRVLGNATIVTNGDQTDTIYKYMEKGKSFVKALRTRRFEPDAPNYTPRISGLLRISDSTMKYKLSILKCADEKGEGCERFLYEYDEEANGTGHLIHTYRENGNPIPSFEGEPCRVALSGNIDAFGEGIWQALNEENKVSLFVRYISLDTGKTQDRIYNKYEKTEGITL
ncbi:MAG: IMP cyclohydrolase [Oscillospiraceae bacterium]